MDPNLMPGGDAGSTEPTEAQKNEANDWDNAAKDLFPALHKSDETTSTTTVETTQAPESTTTTTTVASDESTTTTTTVEPTSTTTTTTLDPNETAEQKVEREKEEAKEAARIAAEVDENLPDVSAREARQNARDAARAVDETAADVREKMFADAPTVLQDADGDPITSIADVMKLVNPVTGEGFTQEEAGMWLLSAQQRFNQGLAEMDKKITQIAEVNVDLKDQADSITYRYGELLKADKNLRDRVWAEYEKTLVKDPKTGIVTSMPVSLESFYDIALAPYAKLAESMENTNNAAEQQKVEDARKEAEEKKRRELVDRSDIFGRGDVDDVTDPEDKEWATAANMVFGPKKK